MSRAGHQTSSMPHFSCQYWSTLNGIGWKQQFCVFDIVIYNVRLLVHSNGAARPHRFECVLILNLITGSNWTTLLFCLYINYAQKIALFTLILRQKEQSRMRSKKPFVICSAPDAITTHRSISCHKTSCPKNFRNK